MNPLGGLLTEAWRFCRSHALRLLLTALACFLPARAVSAAIYGSGAFYGTAGGAWGDLAEVLAALLMLSVVARMVTAGAAGAGAGEPAGGRAPSLPRSLLRPAAVAAALAAVLAGAWSLLPLAGHFAALISLPTVYVGFMGLLTVPVAVIEQSGPLRSWRRSWRLIRRHEWDLLNALVVVWLVNLLVLIVPILVEADPGLPFPPRHAVLWVAEEICYGPLLAVAVTLAYCRLSAASQPAGPAGPAGPVSGQAAGGAA